MRRSLSGAPRTVSGARGAAAARRLPTTVGEVDEFALIDRLARILPPGPRPVVGIGDDAALVPTGPRTLVTTDTLEESVHFRRDWSLPEEVGWRALAVNLSDVAAMGGRPQWAVVSLLLPPDLPLAAVERLYRGVAAAARRYDVGVVGGNVSRSGGRGVSIGVTLLGAPGTGGPLLRSGGRPGDLLVVTGYPGLAAAGRLLLETGGASDDLWGGAAGRSPGAPGRRGAAAPEYALADPAARAALRRFLRPEPRVAAGLWAAAPGRARAGIDLSDGLAADLGHLMRASNCGARLERSLLPFAPGFERLAAAVGAPPEALILSGGDDYELLWAVPPARWASLSAGAARAAGVRLTVIGHLTGERSVLVLADGPREAVVTGSGWRHFGG